MNHHDLSLDGFRRLMEEIKEEIDLLDTIQQRKILSDIFACIDNTTLNGSDSTASVKEFCHNTKQMQLGDGTQVASVCVYPSLVSTAKKSLRDSDIKVASVACGFPAGQIPTSLKIEETRYAIDEGADEIDMVINRGAILEGDTARVADEVAAVKEVCGKGILLKVILETGELQSPQTIYSTSLLALEAGADFVKTSTGKISTGATPEVAYSMLSAIIDFSKINNREIGFKAAGGISTLNDAMTYYLMTTKMLNCKNIDKHIFRIGASRLTNQVFQNLTNK